MVNATTSASTSFVQRLVLITSVLFAVCASSSYAQNSSTPDDAMQEWLDPKAYGAHEDKTDAAATTQAWLDCIADAIAKKKGIRFKGDHLLNTDMIAIASPLIIEGNGIRVSRLFTAGPGVLLTVDCFLNSSTGAGVQMRDFGLFSEQPLTEIGSIGIKLTNTGLANSAFSWLSHLVVSGFHDAVVVQNQYFYTISNCYIDNYRRFGILVNNNWMYDAGDGIIENNWIQPIQTTLNTGYDQLGSNIRVEQNPGIRILNNKLFPGHTKGVHIAATGVIDGDAITSGMYLISGNQFDSFGYNRSAIVIDSEWGRGKVGTDKIGNLIGNVQIIGNNLSNTARLVDIRSFPGATQMVSIVGNTAIGGGGIKVFGTVNGLFIDGNYFDNRTHGAVPGPGVSDTKPIEVSGTATNATAGSNKFIGFAAAADIADAAGGGGTALDATPSIRNIPILTDVASVAPTSSNVKQSHEIIAGQDFAIAFTGVADGDEGTILVKQNGDGRAITWAVAPQGYTLLWEGNTPGAFGAVDDHVDLVTWQVRGSYIIRKVSSLGVVQGSTQASGAPDDDNTYVGPLNLK